MRQLKDLLNLIISIVGLTLFVKLTLTYGNPIRVGALFVLLVCVKCCVEVIEG